MMCNLGQELQQATQALTPPVTDSQPMQILDICMAPGGYATAALKYQPNARACGISLPESLGGHALCLQPGQADVEYLDVLIEEYSDNPIPPSYPKSELFSTKRPFMGQRFDLVFCDGQVLRTNKPHREDYCEPHEAFRLTISQLILALQRIRTAGSLVMLLHKVERWHSVELLYRLSSFAKVQLWKSKTRHQTRSSFYVVAKDVRPECQAAKEVLAGWRSGWWEATFGGEDGTGRPSETVEKRR